MKFTGVVPPSLIVIALVGVLPYPVFAQIDPRILGTWKLNLAKSDMGTRTTANEFDGNQKTGWRLGETYDRNSCGERQP
jgi:hypothetical protein